jgi:uncharacterized membrane protein
VISNYLCVSGVYKGYLYIWGGYNGLQDTHYGDMFKYDPCEYTHFFLFLFLPVDRSCKRILKGNELLKEISVMYCTHVKSSQFYSITL